MEASKKHIYQSEKARQINEICNSIGERRLKDLMDSLGILESTSGWNTAIEYLISASKGEYSIPVGQQYPNRLLEPLKFREVVFAIFDCTGLEPIQLDTNDLLAELSDVNSFAVAKSQFIDRIRAAAYESINSHNTLFFETELFSSDLFDDIKEKIEDSHQRSIENLSLFYSNDLVSILPLWYCEYGRRALAELGIHKSRIPKTDFEMVISVLQVSRSIKERLLQSLGTANEVDSSKYTKPMNPIYTTLLDAIINDDIDSLRNLGSRHACPTFSYLLKTYVDRYKTSESSQDYRNLLLIVRDHVLVRWNDSIITIAELTQLSDERMVTDAINALGNFYHESSVSTLLDIFCNSNNQKTRKLILKTINHLRIRCPEAQSVVHQILNNDCSHIEELRKFYHKTWERQ